MSKRKLTYKDFINYFSNHLQNKDKHAFEKDMMRDAFEEEAFDGLSQLSESELENDIAELKSRIDSKTKKRRTIFPVWFKYAASVIILVGIGITVVYLNSNHWQQSVLKEQVSNEMEIIDSMIFESEKMMPVTRQDTFKETEVKEMVADNKSAKNNEKGSKVKRQDKIVPLEIVDDDLEIEDELILEDTETDQDDKIEIAEFEEYEEVVEEEKIEYAIQEQTIEVSSKKEKGADKAPNIRIRGTSKPSKSEQPLYVIDGRTVDLENMRKIEGRIVNSNTGLSISGATIILKDLQVFNTQTDTNGEFSLTYPNDDNLKTLIASFVGMETVEINLNEDSTFIVYMEPEIIQLDEIVNREDKKGIANESFNKPAQPPANVSINKYKKQIIENLDYSKFKDYSGKYKIKVAFNINSDGSLRNFRFMNAPDKTFSDELKRIILELGDWEPKIENNRSVSSNKEFTLRIEIE